MAELWELFTMFFNIGALLLAVVCNASNYTRSLEKKRWATDEEIIDCFAIGQCTPGVIAVNTATFIGYKRKGIMGGCCNNRCGTSFSCHSDNNNIFKHFSIIKLYNMPLVV